MTDALVTHDSFIGDQLSHHGNESVKCIQEGLLRLVVGMKGATLPYFGSCILHVFAGSGNLPAAKQRQHVKLAQVTYMLQQFSPSMNQVTSGVGAQQMQA